MTAAVAPTTAISIWRRYSSLRVAASRSVGRERHLDLGEELVRRPREVAPGPVRSSVTGTRRSPDAERSIASAPKTMSGPPISIAGEAFMTLPPIVPCALVARDPTIAEASAIAVSRSRTV